MAKAKMRLSFLESAAILQVSPGRLLKLINSGIISPLTKDPWTFHRLEVETLAARPIHIPSKSTQGVQLALDV